jgi:Flp pilus assembly pilin Flp
VFETHRRSGFVSAIAEELSFWVLLGGAKMKHFVTRLWREEAGQDLTEYALLLVLLVLAAIGSLGSVANAINAVFAKAATNLNGT